MPREGLAVNKKHRPTKPEPFRFNQMTKAELIKTVKALDKRQTKLLNQLAMVTDERDAALAVASYKPDAPKKAVY